MSNNIMFVTQPDLYLADQESVMFIADPNKAETICQLLGTSNTSRTIYWANTNTDPEWVITAGNLSTYIVVDFQENLFYSGVFIDKAKCWYYNNTTDLTRINVNKVSSAEEFVIKLLETDNTDG